MPKKATDEAAKIELWPIDDLVPNERNARVQATSDASNADAATAER